jgi:chloramphenicol O-acetyltransferase
VICRNLVDLMNRPSGLSKKVGSNPIVMVFLNWFMKVFSHLEFKYEASNSKWIDLDSAISMVTMALDARKTTYTLNKTDAHSLDKFVHYKR